MHSKALDRNVLEAATSGNNMPGGFILFIAVSAFGVRVVVWVCDVFVSSHEAVARNPPYGSAKGVLGALHYLL